METVLLSSPFTTYWCNRFIWEPLIEGGLRIARAFEPGRTLSEKSWDVLTGSALMTPLIGAVIWLFWKTFGDPELLHKQPHSFPPPPPPSPIAQLNFLEPEMSLQVLEYDDSTWTVRKEQGEAVFYDCRYKKGNKQIQSWYKEGVLEKMNYRENGVTIEMQLVGNQIQIRENGLHKTYEILPGTRWIQQPSIGLSLFAKEGLEKITFFVVNTEPTVSYLFRTIEHLQMLEMEATKEGEEVIYVQKGTSPHLFQGHLRFDQEGAMQTLSVTGLAGTIKNLNSKRIQGTA